MKAVIHRAYGPADQALTVGEIDQPVPKDDEVLVRVRAASMHADVWHVIEGVPYILRLMGNGVRKPKRLVPGSDLAGVVEATGKAVTRFKCGDDVFGESAAFAWLNGGAYAEYAAVPERYLALKPGNVTFEQAAAVPTPGMIALSNLGGLARTTGPRNVLINGAGGSMGPLALQIAKADGAHVTAVDGAEKLPMLVSLGADRVIDYRNEDYLRAGQRYDLIIDIVAIRSPKEYAHALTPTGTYVPIGHAHYDNRRRRVLGDMPYFITLLLRMMLDPDKRKKMKMLPKAEAMETFRALLASGKLTPVIGRTCPLAQAADAVRWMQEGKTIGRIILTPQA